MPKPHGTYVRIQHQEKTRQKAEESKRTVNLSRNRDLAEFHKALRRVAIRDLNSWYKDMKALATDIKKNRVISKDDKVRKRVSEVLGEVRKVLEKVKDYKQLEGQLEAPARLVIKPPVTVGLAGVELGLIIALTQVLEILVRLRKR